jgi:hypothetical protein
MQRAASDREWSVLVSAVRAGIELLKVGDQAEELAELRKFLIENVPNGEQLLRGANVVHH